MKIDNSIALLSQKMDLNIDKRNDEKLKESTDAFEAILIKEVLDISMKHENSLFGKDAGDKIYNSMYHDAISKNLSGGFGFSKILFDYLKNIQNTKFSF